MSDELELVIERPNEPVERVPWNLGAARRFELDADEIATMREDRIVWRGDTAFSLERADND
jgi:hypothetical protein